MSSFVKDYCIDKMTQKGVDFEEMAEILFDLQKKHMPTLTLETCREHLDKVMDKREVQNAILTGLCLDEAAEKGYMEEPLHEIVSSDDGLYGVDEVLALSIVNIYGSIGLTNFGFLDKILKLPRGVLWPSVPHEHTKCLYTFQLPFFPL